MGLRNMGLKMGFLWFVFLSGLLLSMAQVTPSRPRPPVSVPFAPAPTPAPPISATAPPPPPTPPPPPPSPPLADHYFVLEEKNFTVNCVNKHMLTVNGMFPGPEIRVEAGETAKNVTVNVYNNGTYGVTLHWHGVKQPGNPWSDGPENVTQCPIRPQTNFTQTIIISDEIGTLWWHAHSDWSRATVHGAIIVEPAGKKYPANMQHENETTIVLASWYNGSLTEEAETAKNHSNPSEADAYTINGLTGNYSTWSCPNGIQNDTAFNMTVNSGKTYLLRIVNAVMNEDMFFSIANHNLTVVGIDGAYVEPINTNYIMIGPGNTMDALVTADKVNASNYYYMAASTFLYNGQDQNDTIRNATAILIYNGSHPTEPPVFPTDTLPVKGNYTKANDFVNSIKISPTMQQRAPSGDMDHYYIIDVSVVRETTNTSMYASLNDISFVLPTDGQESLLNTSFGCITNATTCGDIKPFPNQTAGTLTSGQNMIVVDYNQTVEIVYIGNESGAEDHPMHLHGHSFYLVGRGFNETFDNVTSREKFNFTNAPLLNTVGLPYQGWAAIRFFANNPGAWFIHCHLERHASWGMATALIVREGTGENETMLPSPLDMPSCT